LTYTYRNPWARMFEPQEYTRTAEPIEYRGCQIFRVLPTQWDVVKAGVCIAQRTGLEGAKACAAIVEDMESPTHDDVKERMFLEYGHY